MISAAPAQGPRCLRLDPPRAIELFYVRYLQIKGLSPFPTTLRRTARPETSAPSLDRLGMASGAGRPPGPRQVLSRHRRPAGTGTDVHNRGGQQPEHLGRHLYPQERAPTGHLHRAPSQVREERNTSQDPPVQLTVRGFHAARRPDLQDDAVYLPTPTSQRYLGAILAHIPHPPRPSHRETGISCWRIATRSH